MVTLLDLIRGQRDQATKDIAKNQKMQTSQNAESSKRLVNNNLKSFFDAIPKPSDLFLKSRSEQTQRDNTKRDTKSFKTQVPAQKKGISQTQRGSINDFIAKKGNIADVFKSFGF
jgi:hypothetical protein